MPEVTASRRVMACFRKGEVSPGPGGREMGLEWRRGEGSSVLTQGAGSLEVRAFQVGGRKGPLLWEAWNACKANYLHWLDGSGLQLLVMQIPCFCLVCVNVVDCYAHCQLFLILTSQLPVFCYLISILTV